VVLKEQGMVLGMMVAETVLDRKVAEMVLCT